MFVTGCHRSGTSYLSMMMDRVVGAKGFERLSASVDNPKGYFETARLRSINEKYLNMAGYTWDKPPIGNIDWSVGKYMIEAVRVKEEFKDYSLMNNWVDKDPRLCITLDLYNHMLMRRIPTIVTVRDPLEVQESMFFRDGFSAERGLLIWFLYNRSCSKWLDGRYDQTVGYKEIINGETQTLSNISTFIGKAMEIGGTDIAKRLVESHASSTVESLSRRRGSSKVDARRELIEYCEAAYMKVKIAEYEIDAMKETFADVPALIIDSYHSLMSEDEPGLEYLRTREARGISTMCATGNEELDSQLIDSYADLAMEMHDMRNELREFRSDHINREEQLGLLQLELERIKSSLSWKLTGPLRGIMKHGKTLKKKVFKG